MKKQFIDQGIPYLQSRAYYIYYVTKQARANGFLPFYWDVGDNPNNLGLFARRNLVVFD